MGNPQQLFSNITWEKVRDKVKTLPGRLGFGKGDRLEFFGFVLDLESGAIYDNVLERRLSDAEAMRVYIILSLYAETVEDVGESGELIPLDRGVCPFIHEPSLRSYVDAIAEIFGGNPATLYSAAEPFGYVKIELGDAAVKIYTLPRVPLVLVVWSGEEGIPPKAQILLDKNSAYYLSSDAIVRCRASEMLSLMLVSRLILRVAKILGIDASSIEFVSIAEINRIIQTILRKQN